MTQAPAQPTSDLAAHLAQTRAETADLALDRFDESEALALGLDLIRRAQGAPVVISVRAPHRVLFHAALPGSSALNDRWAARKAATALEFGESSLAVTLRHRLQGGDLAVHGLDNAAFALSGGAVPVMVKGSGLVAVAVVSGLHETEDHALVIAALRARIAAQTGKG